MAETSYQMLEVLSFWDQEKAQPASIRIIQYCQLFCWKNAPINVNPVGGGGVRARGGDLMPETIPLYI